MRSRNSPSEGFPAKGKVPGEEARGPTVRSVCARVCKARPRPCTRPKRRGTSRDAVKPVRRMSQDCHSRGVPGGPAAPTLPPTQGPRFRPRSGN